MTSFHSCFGPGDGRQFRLVRVCVCNRLLLGICYLGGVSSLSVIILFEPFLWVSLTMVFLAGAFIAAQAPTMGSLAVRKFGDLAPMVIPIYEAVGTMAGIFGPPVVGQLAEQHGLAQVLWIVPAAGFVLAVTSFTWYFWDRQHEQPVTRAADG